LSFVELISFTSYYNSFLFTIFYRTVCLIGDPANFWFDRQ